MTTSKLSKHFRRLINQTAPIELFHELLKTENNYNFILKAGESESPIHLAVVENQLDVVKLLISHGASLQPLEIYAKPPNPYPEFDDFGIDDDENRFTGDPVITAAASGKQEIFNFLAPLASPQQRRAAVLLLAEGIQRNSVSDSPDNGHFQRVIDHRPDDDSDDFGQWLTDLAEATIIRRNPIECLREKSLAFAEYSRNQISQGDNANVILDNGTTLLWIAALNGYVEAVSTLLELGAAVDIPNQTDGWTPLMITVDTHIPWVFGTQSVWREIYSRQMEIASLLLQYGANINQRGNNNETTLSLASQFDRHQEFDVSLIESSIADMLALLTR